MDEYLSTPRDSAAWLFFVRLCFVLSVGSTGTGIFFLAADLWAKAFMGMGLLFVVGSTITMAKTLRDDHEARRLLNRLNEAQTTKFLRDNGGLKELNAG